MNSIDELLEQVSYDYDHDMLYPTDLKDAIVGTVERIGMEPILLLDKEKCLEILMERDGMSDIDAIEHFEYNVIGSYVDGVPAYATFIDGVLNKPHVCKCGGNCKK